MAIYHCAFIRTMDKIASHIKTDFNFLMLIDFSKDSYEALDYLIKLVKVIGGQIELISIIEPSDVIKSENPVVALRAISKDKVMKKIRLDSIVEMIQSEGIRVQYSLSTGRLEDELNGKLTSNSSDIIVTGKSKVGSIGKVNNYLVHKFKGNLLIIGKQLEFQTGTNITVGCNIKTLNTCDLKLTSIFSLLTKTPLVLLEVGKISIDIREFNKTGQFHENLAIQYKNEKNPNIIEGLKTHIDTTNVELLCIGRSKRKNSFFSRILKPKNTMTEIVKNTKIPLLIMANK